MKETLKLFKVLSDETRLRMIHLLGLQELTATELGAILNLGQSRTSTQLAQIREALSLEERREGRKLYLRLDREDETTRRWLEQLGPEIRASETCRADRARLAEEMRRRREERNGFRAQAPGGLGRRYLPGRTWEGFARALLRLIAPRRVLDVGIGDGEMTLLLAERAGELVAVDPDAAALARLEQRARALGLGNLETREGELGRLPHERADRDLVVMSQVLHFAEDPAAALRDAARLLEPGGRLLVLDLRAHGEAWVRDKLGHRQLGFEAEDLERWLDEAGLESEGVVEAARDRKAPHFVSLLATAIKLRKGETG